MLHVPLRADITDAFSRSAVHGVSMNNKSCRKQPRIIGLEPRFDHDGCMSDETGLQKRAAQEPEHGR